ncbi:MAG: hypothetical protein MOGMAGMI_01589 [Candidatus Omnitrophica bacterium]|nr:hypothetical protein [Candidatus Omnitrophota bacterium]
MTHRKLMTLALVAALAGLSQPAWANWADRSLHESGEAPTYKHGKKSFTGPFDYAPTGPAAAPAPKSAPTGRCNTFTFDATKSWDIDKQKLAFAWDFGDGTTSDQPVVTKSYDKAGDYTVTLTVRDSSGMVCDSGVASTRVSANFPPNAVAGEAQKVCVGQTVNLNGSASTASGPAKYMWNFGDGTTGEGQSVSHVYDKPGTYRVVLTVDDEKNTECSVDADSTSVTVFDRATVSLTGPEAACTGSTAHFKAPGTGGNLKYRWDFGDGTTADGGSTASHVYTKGGDYTVTVFADNGTGSDCAVATASHRIRVNSRPIADAGENTACCVGQTVSFDGSRSADPEGDALTYNWSFGDGATAEGAQVSHTYDKPGQYRVVLTVKDASGSDCGLSSDSFVAVVNAKPEAIIEVR